MYTLMNKQKKMAWIALCFFCILRTDPPAFSQEVLPEYIIDVSNGCFILGDYEFSLKEMKEPISVGVIDGDVQIQIHTAQGVEKLSLGEGSLSLTERAVPYVTILDDARESALQLDQYETCPVCGRSTGIGMHEKQKCGHYGCLVSIEHLKICPDCGAYVCNSRDHTPCPHCEVRMCVHENIKCEYMRNPVPTPYSTKIPEEGTSYFVFSEDGSRVDGAFGITAKTTPWSPGEEFAKTPPPNSRTDSEPEDE